jgi:hypothetical protein
MNNHLIKPQLKILYCVCNKVKSDYGVLGMRLFLLSPSTLLFTGFKLR